MTGKREKNTLLMFAATLLFGFACICAYIYLGHNWNYVVSQADDAFGDMESYTVLLYDGTITPVDPADVPQLLPVQTAEPEPDVATIAANEQRAAEAAQQAEESADEAQDTEDEGEEKPLGLGERISRKFYSFFNLDTDSEASDSDVQSVQDDPLVVDDIAQESGAKSLDDIARAYYEKGANSFVLNVSDLGCYEEGLIMERGSSRIGVLSVHSIKSCASLQKKVDYLRSLDADLIVAVVDEVPRIAGISGIDVVIRANDSFPDAAEAASGRYIAVAPAQGSVGATIISPSNIAISKVL